MTELERMIESCKTFSKNPKIGKVKFSYDSGIKRFFIFFRFFDCTFFLNERKQKFMFEYSEHQKCIELKANTAKNAAKECIRICRKEAQSIIDTLSEPYMQEIDNDNKNCKIVRDTIIEILKESEKPQARRDLILKVYERTKLPFSDYDLYHLVELNVIERVGIGTYKLINENI